MGDKEDWGCFFFYLDAFCLTRTWHLNVWMFERLDVWPFERLNDWMFERLND